MKQLTVPRPQTVQPVTVGYETERIGAFHRRLTRSDVTNEVYMPGLATEPVALTNLHVLRSNSFSPRGTNNELTWVEAARIEGSLSLLPVLSVGRTCAICGSLLVDPGKITVPMCEHVYCRVCLSTYLQLRVTNGEVLKMPCPTYECASVISEEMVATLVGPESLEKYLRFKRNLEIETNPKIRHCPKTDCQGYAEGGVDRPRLECNLCGHSFCYYCQEPWHHGSPCHLESDRLLDSWARANHVKFCPNCHRKVEKASGCDHMTCVKCRYDWCWKCGREFTQSHEEHCAVSRSRKRNPPWIFTVSMLFSPVLVPFLFLILVIYYLEALRRDVDVREEKGSLKGFLQRRWMAYPLLGTVTLILTPLAYVVVILFGGGVMLMESRVFMRGSEGCWKDLTESRSVWVTVSMIVGMLLAPVVGGLLIVAVLGAHVAGLSFTVFKAYISLRRCCDPDYLQPDSAPGYLF